MPPPLITQEKNETDYVHGRRGMWNYKFHFLYLRDGAEYVTDFQCLSAHFCAEH